MGKTTEALLCSLLLPLCASVPALTGPGLTDLKSGGFWDADLGVPLVDNKGTLWIMEGDVGGNVQHARVANAIARATGPCRNPSNSSATDWSFKWQEDSNGLASQFYPLLAESTVPAGAFSLPSGELFVYMMNVTAWNSGNPGDVVAAGMLIGGALGPSGVPQFNKVLWHTTPSSGPPMTNAAPVIFPKDGRVYVFSTGRYRASPIFLSRVDATAAAVGNLSAYQWWNGNGFVSDYNAAASLLGTDPSETSAGELSVMWHSSGRLFLCFFAFSPGVVLFCTACDTPYGDWTGFQVVMAGPQPWWPPGSWGPYGSYLMPERACDTEKALQKSSPGSNSTDVDVDMIVSLWVPYRSYVVPVTLRA